MPAVLIFRQEKPGPLIEAKLPVYSETPLSDHDSSTLFERLDPDLTLWSITIRPRGCEIERRKIDANDAGTNPDRLLGRGIYRSSREHFDAALETVAQALADCRAGSEG